MTVKWSKRPPYWAGMPSLKPVATTTRDPLGRQTADFRCRSDTWCRDCDICKAQVKPGSVVLSLVMSEVKTVVERSRHADAIVIWLSCMKVKTASLR